MSFSLIPILESLLGFLNSTLLLFFLRHCNLKTNSTMNIVLFYVYGKIDMKGAICFCVSIPLEPADVSSLRASSDQLPQHKAVLAFLPTHFGPTLPEQSE